MKIKFIQHREEGMPTICTRADTGNRDDKEAERMIAILNRAKELRRRAP